VPELTAIRKVSDPQGLFSLENRYQSIGIASESS
jgi:hypothetical protein